MAIYRIAASNNVTIGEYEGATATEAWCAMARDAGYKVHVDGSGRLVMEEGDEEVLGRFHTWNVTEVI